MTEMDIRRQERLIAALERIAEAQEHILRLLENWSGRTNSGREAIRIIEPDTTQ